MAEKILNTRILLKVDTLENWNASTLPLKKGELAIATVAATAGSGLTEPVTMIKIGEDGEKTFKDLEWNFYAKASDVLAAAKSEAKLTEFINAVIADAGIASDDAMEALAGRVTTAEGKITTLEGTVGNAEGGLVKSVADNAAAIAGVKGLVGDEKVSDQISTAIAALSSVYAGKALEKTVADHVADEVTHVTTADKTKWNAALQASDIAAGSANGTVAVKGIDVAITGLGSAAFTEASAYDAAGAATGAESAAKAYAKEYADGLAKNYDAVGSAAAAESAAKAYADGLAGNYDAAGAADAAEAAAKKYTDDEIKEWVGDKTVQAQISELKLGETYATKGEAAAAESNAKAHADGLNTAMNTRVEALEAIDHEHANAEELAKIAEGDVAKWNAAEQNAKDYAKEYADGLDKAMDARVLALEGKFGEGEGNVESQIEAAVAAEAKLREDADADLQEQITANDGEIATLQGLVGDGKVEERIAAAVKVEKERAEGIEGGLRTDVDAIKEDYLKAADKQDLQDQIDLIMDNPDTKDVIDSIAEFTKYITDHGTIADGFRTDIDANADAIEAVEGRVGTAEGKISALEEASATHAAQADLEALEEIVEAKAAKADLEDAVGRVATLEGEMNAVEGRATALEGLVGDVKVETRISEAIEALKIGDYAKAAALTEEVNRAKAAEKANADAIALKANDADLKAVAKSGLIDDLSIGEGTVLIFDCGNATV